MGSGRWLRSNTQPRLLGAMLAKCTITPTRRFRAAGRLTPAAASGPPQPEGAAAGERLLTHPPGAAEASLTSMSYLVACYNAEFGGGGGGCGGIGGGNVAATPPVNSTSHQH